MGIICYGYWSVVYNPMGKEIDAKQHELDDLNQKLAAAKARANQLAKIQEEMSTLEMEVVELEKQLPKDRELPSLLRILTHRAEAYGLALASFTPQRPVSKGSYDEIGYNITLSSSFHSLGKFLTAMGKGDRLFAARNLALTSAGNKNDMSKTVNATFQLVAFKYHE